MKPVGINDHICLEKLDLFDNVGTLVQPHESLEVGEIVIYKPSLEFSLVVDRRNYVFIRPEDIIGKLDLSEEDAHTS